MTKNQIEKSLNILLRDLEKCDQRCQKISEAAGIENNEVIAYAVEQTKLVLEYIESLKDEAK